MAALATILRLVVVASTATALGACSSDDGGGSSGSGGAAAGGTGGTATGGSAGTGTGGVGGSASCGLCSKLAGSDCSQEIKDACASYCESYATAKCQSAFDTALSCLAAAPSVSCACSKTPIFEGCDDEIKAYWQCEGAGTGCVLGYDPDDGSCSLSCPTFSGDCKPEGSGYSCVCSSGPNLCKKFTFQMKCDQGTGWDDVVEANCK